MTTTWNPADLGPGISLDGSHLVATYTGSATDSAFRATSPQSTLKRYHEVTATIFTAIGSLGGVGNSSASLVSFVGGDPFSIGYYYDGRVLTSAGAIDTISAWTQGDVVSVATDLVNNRIWFRKNAGLWNNNGSADPVGNVGGYDISSIAGPLMVMSALHISGDQFTANFGATAYAQTVPSGYVNWDGSGGGGATPTLMGQIWF